MPKEGKPRGWGGFFKIVGRQVEKQARRKEAEAGKEAGQAGMAAMLGRFEEQTQIEKVMAEISAVQAKINEFERLKASERAAAGKEGRDVNIALLNWADEHITYLRYRIKEMLDTLPDYAKAQVAQAVPAAAGVMAAAGLGQMSGRGPGKPPEEMVKEGEKAAAASGEKVSDFLIRVVVIAAATAVFVIFGAAAGLAHPMLNAAAAGVSGLAVFMEWRTAKTGGQIEAGAKGPQSKFTSMVLLFWILLLFGLVLKIAYLFVFFGNPLYNIASTALFWLTVIFAFFIALKLGKVVKNLKGVDPARAVQAAGIGAEMGEEVVKGAIKLVTFLTGFVGRLIAFFMTPIGWAVAILLGIALLITYFLWQWGFMLIVLVIWDIPIFLLVTYMIITFRKVFFALDMLQKKSGEAEAAAAAFGQRKK